MKQRPGARSETYRYEAAGLGWLREAHEDFGGCPVPRVTDVGVDRLTLDFVATVPPTAEAARTFGSQLANTHRAGAEKFGELPTGIQYSFIADLELPQGTWETFGSFYAQGRIRPLALRARSTQNLTEAEFKAVIELAEHLEAENPQLTGPSEPIARLHGDLWSGNVLWRKRDCVIIDPSAHGGHRETDLAMLALFGLPRLDEVMDAYNAQWPLAPGWKGRIPLHQVYPLLVHAILFGGSYGAAAAKAAHSALANVST